MSGQHITTVKELHRYLYIAMQLEHATIPPYLVALYSIHPDTNFDATRILRIVAVEEMLHLTQAANILNAVGGEPDLTAPKFVVPYPATLPDGEKDFTVSLRPFSCAALDTFLKIERPKKAPNTDLKLVKHEAHTMSLPLTPSDRDDFYYYSIGEFYAAIAEGINFLASKMGNKLFCGDPRRQVLPEYYYSGGGRLTVVTGLQTALQAIDRVIEQGEGFDYGILTREGELAHDFRFEQLKLGRYYQRGNGSDIKPDEPGRPTGPEIHVDWDAVYPMKVNPRLSDFKEDPALYAAAVSFNHMYADLLRLVTKSYNGEPELLTDAVHRMFQQVRNHTLQLMRNPVPGMTGLNAGPTFEIAHAGAVTA